MVKESVALKSRLELLIAKNKTKKGFSEFSICWWDCENPLSVESFYAQD